MTVDPLTRRVLDEMEQERKAREEAEAEERKLAERLAALTPEEREEFDRRMREKKDGERANAVFALGICILVLGCVLTLGQLLGSGGSPRELSVGSLLQFAGDVPAIFIMIAGLVLLSVADHWRGQTR